MEQEWGHIRGGGASDLQATLVQRPVQDVVPVHRDVFLKQKVHLVKPVDVYPGRTKWVQDRTQEPEDVLHVINSANIHQVPVCAIFLPSKTILVLVLVLGGSFVPRAPTPVDL
jgi:hypothetical protein